MKIKLIFFRNVERKKDMSKEDVRLCGDFIYTQKYMKYLTLNRKLLIKTGSSEKFLSCGHNFTSQKELETSNYTKPGKSKGNLPKKW